MTDTSDDTPEDDSPFRSPQEPEAYCHPNPLVQHVRTIARYQKMVVLSAILNVIYLFVWALSVGPRAPMAVEGWVFQIVMASSMLMGMVSVFLLVNEINHRMNAIFCSLALWIPVVGLGIMLSANHAAIAYLKDRGIEAGIFGPEPNTFRDLENIDSDTESHPKY